jgi:hypothetical protein
VILALLLGCRDKALAPFADALAAYEDGRTKADAGDPAAAAEAFATARTKDPGSPALVAWEAKARADAGHPEQAEALLDELLADHPDLGLARYNRAAYRARQGRLGPAAEDLRAALEAGVASPYAAAEDPDFAPHRADPAFAGLLPAIPLVGHLKGPEGSVWIGSTVEVKVQLESLATATLALRREGADPGCLHLDRVVEDDAEQADVRLREVTLRMTATAPCTATLGPFVASVGTTDTALGTVDLVVEAPPGTGGSAAKLPAVIPIPSQLAPSGATVRVEPGAGGTVAMGPLDAGLTAEGKKPAYALEWRMAGQTRAIGGFWEGTVVVTERPK